MNWVLVTGGARGLGAEICRTLSEKGRNVLVHYRTNEKKAVEVSSYCQSFGVLADIIHGDFSTLEGIQEFLINVQKKFSPIESLVNNVGNYFIKSALNTHVNDWYNLFQTNLHTPFVLIHSLAESIKEGQGSIVNIGVAGIHSARADIYSSAYSISKHSLFMLTKSLAKELAPFLVNVNMVSPGLLEESIDQINVPMNRPGTFQEAARLVAFLLEKENRYITGQNIEVSGGIRL